MIVQRATTILLLLLFASQAFAEILLHRGGRLQLMGPWPLLIFVAIGSATAVIGRRLSATPILCLLLASMGVILSGVVGLEDLYEIPAAEFFRFEWSALRLFFGFGFLHFALTFPVESRLVRKHPRVLSVIWGVYLVFLLLTLPIVPLGRVEAAVLWVLSLLAGLIVGVFILIRKFFVSLTAAEKNRLRVVLVGCLAGAVPAALAAISWVLPFNTQEAHVLDIGFFMLPLFPLGLVTAVLHENFSEISKGLQRTLIYCLAAAGSITCFFICHWLVIIIMQRMGGFPVNPIMISGALALLSLFPLIRWSSSYIATRFYATEEAEAASTGAATAFCPIEPNPYIAGNPIRSPELFFGREEDFRFIRARLLGEEQGCVIVLRGERRTGKTSILYQILNGRLGPDFVPVFIDMQGMVVQNDAEFLSELALKISEAALSSGSMDKGSLPVAVDTYPAFNHYMDALLAALGHRRLVLLMDEYELIENKAKNGKVSAEIFGYLDSLLIRHARLSYVFTGSKGLDSSEVWMPILARSVYREVSFLARKDAQALICTPLRERIQFAPGAVSHLLRLTSGHPFFTQALCQTMVDMLNEMRTNLVDSKCIQETLKRLMENAPPQLYYLWTTFSNPEKAVLSGLAALIKEPNRYLTAERVEKLLKSLPGEFPKSLSAPLIRMHFEQLREKAMLDRDQTRYRFTMDLMRLWVQSEHNVWKVLSETAAIR